MKRKKIIIIAFLILTTLLGGLVYNYTFNSKHRDIAIEKATMALTAKELHFHFQNDEALATANYLDKVIETEGKVTSIEDNEIVLSNQIQVSFNKEYMPKVTEGTFLTIKGRCLGYDELLETVKIDQATVINK